ncbi:hypothetical protein [Robiginitalea sediminis]|uniref:hypothetical protein n=1 Tax=Robiginitalea sediminis TaxID=1982593 RepID=UPI000B4B2845|nr:hypothetical protein [Robiginitalea sediminis]
MIKIEVKNVLIVLFSILLISCTDQKREKISIVVTDIAECSNCVMPSSCIRLLFHEIEKETEIDWSAFNLLEGDHPESELLDEYELDELLEMIDKDQLVVENAEGHRRFFSDIKTFKNETIPVTSIFDISEKGGTLQRLKSGQDIGRVICLNLNRLKINEDDKKIKVYWLVKDKSKGENGVVLSSNWIAME